MAETAPRMTELAPNAPPSYAEVMNENPPPYDPKTTQPAEPTNITADQPLVLNLSEEVITTQPINTGLALSNIEDGEDLSQEERQRREEERIRQQEDCCWDPEFDEDDCYACYWLCKIFCNPCRMCCRGCGECTDECCEGCADSLNNCCGGSGNEGSGDCCGDGCCDGHGEPDCCSGADSGGDADCDCDCCGD